jgi:hypothetical protein
MGFWDTRRSGPEVIKKIEVFKREENGRVKPIKMIKRGG